MRQQKGAHLSSDKLIWSQIYRTLKDMLKSQQSQIETLSNDREFLENNVYIQHEHWSTNARFLESHIARIKEEKCKTRLVEDAKMAVLVGFKESEALYYKMQLELAESDLQEFRSCVEVLSAEMEELKEKLKGYDASEIKNTDYMIENPMSSENSEGRNQLTLSLKKEIKKLKHSYKELSSRRDSEVSALLVEKDFVWNQFRKIENDYIALLKSKHVEADHQVREAAEKLQDSVQMLQQEIIRKDEIIVKLEAERSMLKLDAMKANNKMMMLQTDMDKLRLAAVENEKLIDNLRKELCNLKSGLQIYNLEKSIFLEKNKYDGKCKSGSSIIRPIHLQRCSKKRNLESFDTHTSQRHANSRGIKCETPASYKIHKRDHNLTEKKRFVSPVEMQASLFHSDFKVPKLKKSRPLIA